MMRLVELVNDHKSKGGIFEILSSRGDRLEILHWSGSFSFLFIDRYSDLVLID